MLTKDVNGKVFNLEYVGFTGFISLSSATHLPIDKDGFLCVRTIIVLFKRSLYRLLFYHN